MTNHNKIRIKPIGGKNLDAIWVYPIDAKEIVGQGTHVYVNEISQKSENVNQVQISNSSEDNDIEKINSMNTRELEQLLKDNSLDIQGFEQMNLKSKREAVILLLESLNEDSGEDEDL